MVEAAENLAPGRPAARWWNGWPAAAVVLAGFYALMISAWAGKSVTMDEIAHVAGGASYWHFNDYRMNPENGMLPQRVAGLALLRDRFPPRDQPAWEESDQWVIGRQFLHTMGNDTAAMLLRGRMACGLMAAAMGALVYGWSRRLFGPGGGMVSLAGFALSPIVLANGPLMTSDMAAGLFFLAAIAAFWGMLRNLSPLTLALSSLATAGLFVAKMQAAVFLPVAAGMLLVRLLARTPLPVRLPGTRLVAGRAGRLLALAAAVLVQGAVTVAAVWACYGFRYEMLDRRNQREHLMEVWEAALDWPVPYSRIQKIRLSDAQAAALDEALAPAHARAELIESPYRRADLLAEAYQKFLAAGVLTPRQRDKLDRLNAEGTSPVVGIMNFLRAHRLLPEAYLYGHTYVWRHSRERLAFFNGQIGDDGWRMFFPYAFSVKTPLAFLGLLVLAAAGTAAAWRADRRDQSTPLRAALARALYNTCPLWLLMAVYWPLVIFSHINIGHRHLLPIYGPLFVLAGAAVWWLRRPAGRALLAAVTLALAVEVLSVWPDYLPYFNSLVGMSNGYRHLADSSVDWGQDAPALVKFAADRRRARPDRPVYVSYCGNADLDMYGLQANLLPCFPSYHAEKRPPIQIRHDGPEAAPAVGDEEFLLVQAFDSQRDGNFVTTRVLARRPARLRLAAGTYCISASMLQPLLYGHFTGHWCPRYEGYYKNAAWLTELVQHGSDEQFRKALAARPVSDLPILMRQYGELRLARLCAFLRARRPDGNIHHSILVYELSDKDIEDALFGPPPENGPDLAEE